MTKKNIKPYGSSSGRNRTLSNKNISGLGTKKKVKKQKESGDNSLEATTKIRIDSNRINDAESLDTSFLEGRLDKKVRDNSKAKEKILKEKKQIFFEFEIIKWIFFTLAFLCIIILAIIYFKNSPLFKIDDNSVPISDKSVKKQEKDENNVVIDSNYLFVGDFYIDKLNFDDLDYHYVKSSDEKLTTESLLEDMKSKVYDFNPSDIFIQVGVNDLNDDVSIDDIISNYNKIISEIKKNRSYAKIYIIALNYINNDIDEFDSSILSNNVDNDKIKKLNNELKTLAENEKVNYIEIDELYTDNDKLDSRYTDNGIYLNDDGNKIVIESVKDYLE